MAKESKVEFPEIEAVTDMPKPKRGIQGRSESVEKLIGKIGDLKAHRLVGLETKEQKEQWGRKLRYAANLAGLELETVWVGEDTSERPAGLYFRGYEKGKAPKRGQRK